MFVGGDHIANWTDSERALDDDSRLTDPDLGSVEEHLLVCEECRVRLDEEDAFVKAVRAALRHQPE